jgi:hypothetical protein
MLVVRANRERCEFLMGHHGSEGSIAYTLRKWMGKRFPEVWGCGEGISRCAVP